MWSLYSGTGWSLGSRTWIHGEYNALRFSILLFRDGNWFTPGRFNRLGAGAGRGVCSLSKTISHFKVLWHIRKGLKMDWTPLIWALSLWPLSWFRDFEIRRCKREHSISPPKVSSNPTLPYRRALDEVEEIFEEVEEFDGTTADTHLLEGTGHDFVVVRMIGSKNPAALMRGKFIEEEEDDGDNLNLPTRPHLKKCRLNRGETGTFYTTVTFSHFVRLLNNHGKMILLFNLNQCPFHFCVFFPFLNWTCSRHCSWLNLQ